MKYFASAFACLWLCSTTASAAPPIEAYGHLPATELVTLSPSGDRIALVSGIGDDRKVVVRTAEGEALASTKIGDIKVRDLTWAGDDHLIILSSVTRATGFYLHNEWAGGEVSVASVLNVKTKTVFVVFKTQELFPAVLGTEGYREIDGHWYGYFEGAIKPRQTLYQADGNVGTVSLYRVDLDTGTYTMAGAGDRDWILDTDGSVLVHAAGRRENGTSTWELFAGQHEHDEIEEHDSPFGDIALKGLGRTAGTYLVEKTSPTDAGLWEQSRVPGQAPVNLTAAPVIDLLRDGTGLAIGAETEGDTPQALLFDPARQAAFDAVKQAFAPATVRAVSFGPNRRLIVKASSDTDSGTYYFIDIPHQNVVKIGTAYPDVAETMIGKTEVVHYKAKDGLALDGILTLPPGGATKNLPLVVMPHGGPMVRDHLGFDWTAQSFASRGYAVFQPNFRGSAGYGPQFRNAGFGEWGRKMQTDISDGVAELAGKGTIDPHRVAAVGLGYGGYAALAGVTLQQGLYRCAVSYGGITDLNDLMSTQAEFDNAAMLGETPTLRLRHKYLGTDSNHDAVVDRLSPARRAGDADAPVLLMYGADDTVVSPRQTEAMAKALTAAGKPAELVKLENEDHWLSHGASRIAMLKAAVAFVEKYNPATVSP